MLNDEHYAEFATELSKHGKDETLVMMRGYLAPSEHENAVRLYFDPELKAFIDISKDDIRHSVKDETSKLGAAFVWTTPDLRYVAPAARNVSEKAEANPFDGERVSRQYNQVARLASGRAIVATMGCNATTPNAYVGGGLFSAVTPVIPEIYLKKTPVVPDLFARQNIRFATGSCNATTPNGEEIPRRKNMLGTARCNATSHLWF